MQYKVFVINLKRDTERLAYMTEQLQALGVDFERIDAIDGKEYLAGGGDEYNPELAHRRSGRTFTAGEVGCALSHKRCYEKVMEDGLDYALILEDDVTLNETFGGVLHEVTQAGLWDYVQFSYADISLNLAIRLFRQRLNVLLHTDSIILRFKKLPFLVSPFIRLIMRVHYWFWLHSSLARRGVHRIYFEVPALAGCYLVSNKGAKAFLQCTKHIVYVADLVMTPCLRKHRHLLFGVYTPRIVSQKEIFASTIDATQKRVNFFGPRPE